MADYDGEITIQKKTFKMLSEVSNRYKAGHVLNENEAGVLNQTLAENLRNNFASKVRDGVEAGVDDETLQQQFDDYATDYEFGVRTGGGGFRGDPVMTLAMAAARQLFRNYVKTNKLDEDEWNAAKITQVAKQLLDRQGPEGKIITAARKQVEAEQAAAKEALAEVGEIASEQTAQAAE